MTVKTNRARQNRKAKNKANQELRTKAPKFDVTKLFQALEDANRLVRQLKNEGINREATISEVLEEHDKRLMRIEDEIFTDTDKRRSDTGESTRTDDAEGGRGVPVSSLQETNKDIQKTPTLRNGSLSDQTSKELPADAPVVHNEGTRTSGS
jgi:hypothetical protein